MSLGQKRKITGNHFESLERFMSHWQEKPKEMCHFVGRAVGRIAHRNIPDLFFAISTAYFSLQEICERIDYIYENYQKSVKGECGKLLKQLIKVNEREGIVCLKDISDNHHSIQIMLIRYVVDGYSTYSIRYFIEATFDEVLQSLPENSAQLYEDDFNFWNFRKPDEILEGVIVYPDAQGFYDLPESKNVADFIVLTSNLLRYKCISDNPPIIP